MKEKLKLLKPVVSKIMGKESNGEVVIKGEWKIKQDEPESRGKPISLLPHHNTREEGDLTLSPYPLVHDMRTLVKRK